MANEIAAEVAPGHVIRGQAEVYGPFVGAWSYSCSCGEIAGVDTAAAQAHADEVTP